MNFAMLSGWNAILGDLGEAKPKNKTVSMNPKKKLRIAHLPKGPSRTKNTTESEVRYGE